MLITIITTAVAALILFMQKDQYLSTVTALPSNSASADRAKIFNTNIQHLYSPFGSPDELDRIEGTALLNSPYLATAGKYNLVQHYNAKDSNHAAATLQKNSRIYRSEHGTLKIKVWDEDKEMAANLANGLFNEIQDLHSRLQSQADATIVKELENNYNNLLNSYPGIDTGSINSTESELRKRLLNEQLYAVAKQKSEFDVRLAAQTPPLLLMEAATPSSSPDKPERLKMIILVFAAALIFSLLIAFFLESRKVNG